MTGSGSVITKDVAADALALARGQQVEKPGWAARFRDADERKKAAKTMSADDQKRAAGEAAAALVEAGMTVGLGTGSTAAWFVAALAARAKAGHALGVPTSEATADLARQPGHPAGRARRGQARST